jgi:hypothetical protein
VKLCGARALFRQFATLPVIKIVKFLEKAMVTQSEGYYESVLSQSTRQLLKLTLGCGRICA